VNNTYKGRSDKREVGGVKHKHQIVTEIFSLKPLPKKRDQMEPFSKTNKYFGTTYSPTTPNRKKRSVNEVTEIIRGDK